MESLKQIEQRHTRICKKWLVMESCSACLFETLCRMEKNRKEIQEQGD